MQRLLLFLGFMALGTGMIYLLTVREPSRRAPDPAETPSNVLKMTQVAVRQHDPGGITYELMAREAVLDQRTQETILIDVEFMVFENEAQNPRQAALKGTANRARMDRRGGLVRLSGNVRLITETGAEIRSERIDYEHNKERVVVPGAVWVKAKEMVHQADSLIYDIPSERMTFTSPIFHQ